MDMSFRLHLVTKYSPVFVLSEMTLLQDSSAETRTNLTRGVMITVFVSAATPLSVAEEVLCDNMQC